MNERQVSPIWLATTHEESLELCRLWLMSSALQKLIETLGGPPLKNTIDDLVELVTWSSATLDSRGGGERQAARPIAFAPGRETALIEAAQPLGLMESAGPQRSAYDSIVVLGGTPTANDLRSQLAYSVIQSGVSVGAVFGLGAGRVFSTAETTDSAYETESEDLGARLKDQFSNPSRPDPD